MKIEVKPGVLFWETAIDVGAFLIAIYVLHLDVVVCGFILMITNLNVIGWRLMKMTVDRKTES